MTYGYDTFDRRVRKSVDDDGNGTIDRTERYVYDFTNKTDGTTDVSLDDVVLTFDGSGALTHRYLHGADIDELFADETATGAVLWALDDEQGTIRDWAEYNSGTNTTTVTDHLKYDSYGRITAQSNSAHTVVYAFTGREWDKDVDLQYNRMRWYDPVVGRWISEDPIGFAGGDANLVRYVGNNPVNWEDPSGLERKKSGAGQVDGEWGYWWQITRDRTWGEYLWGTHPDPDYYVGTVWEPDVTANPNYNEDQDGPKLAEQRSRQWTKTAAGMAADGAETVLDAAGNVIPPLGAGIAVGRAAEDGANGNWWGAFWNSVCAGIAIVLGGSGGMKGNARVSVAGKPGSAGDGVSPKTPEPGTPGDDAAGTSTQPKGKLPDGPPTTPGPNPVQNGGMGQKGKYRGGRHGTVKGPVGDGLESHHMPAKSVNGLHPDHGPAIQMDPNDHVLTASHGSQPGSDIYRLRQQRLIEQGDFGEAIQMDIDNVRNLFGDKYDGAIQEMINELEPWMKKGIRG